MREIKFRNWDTNTQKMSTIYRIDNERELNDLFKDKEYIFMQYTGLKDKLGVEIYEGDIILLYEEDEKKNFKYQVEWDNALCGFSPFIDASEQIGIGHLYENLSSEYIEVIGNIYENPELLKEAK